MCDYEPPTCMSHFFGLMQSDAFCITSATYVAHICLCATDITHITSATDIAHDYVCAQLMFESYQCSPCLSATDI